MIDNNHFQTTAELPREDFTPISFSLFPQIPKACKKTDLDHVCLEAVDLACKWLDKHGGTMEITDAYD